MSGADRSVRVLEVVGPRRMRLADLPDRPLAADRFRVDTLASGVSLGTEMSWYRGTNPALRAHWDSELGLFRPGEPAVRWPVRRFGYMQVGVVTASRFAPIVEGARVAMTYGHCSGHTADGLVERAVVLPDGVCDRLGVLVAHMGPICANGLLHAAHDTHGADVRGLGDGVRGREVVIIGAGTVGLLTGLFARAHGAAEVLVIDPTPGRLAAAEGLGLTPLPARPDGSDDLAEQIKMRYRHAPGDRGASVVFQCRGQAAALALALRCTRPQGVVIDLAFYDGGAGEVAFGEEFHHNGLALRCAQIGRVPRGLSPTWDRERLSRETLALVSAHGGAVNDHLLPDDLPFDTAPELFADIDARRRDPSGFVLRFDRPGI
ncbi:MAG: zinc-dependent alcohol dehydrogenase [Pseudonocardia sp.]